MSPSNTPAVSRGEPGNCPSTVTLTRSPGCTSPFVAVCNSSRIALTSSILTIRAVWDESAILSIKMSSRLLNVTWPSEVWNRRLGVFPSALPQSSPNTYSIGEYSSCGAGGSDGARGADSRGGMPASRAHPTSDRTRAIIPSASGAYARFIALNVSSPFAERRVFRCKARARRSGLSLGASRRRASRPTETRPTQSGCGSRA